MCIRDRKAYEELCSEGLVSAVQGKGYIVNAPDTGMIKEQYMRLLEQQMCIRDRFNSYLAQYLKTFGYYLDSTCGNLTTSSASSKRPRAAKRTITRASPTRATVPPAWP